MWDENQFGKIYDKQLTLSDEKWGWNGFEN